MRLLLVLAATLATTAPATAQQIATGDPGVLEKLTVATGEGPAEALLYTPSTVDGSAAVPLYVMSHGCNTEPIQQARADLHHPVAERERFLVLYTDFPRTTHPGRCWRWTDPASQRRGTGDPKILIDQVRAVFALRNVDRDRVYAMGLSSGGMMTSILGATYPDVFAAIGVSAAGPYRTYACEASYFAGYPREETPLLAQSAYEAMGTHARVVPTFVLHGDADETIHPACGVQAAEQWVRTNNLVASNGASQTGPLALDPTITRTVADPGRRNAMVREWRDADGCTIVERWEVTGMKHRWSGGAADPDLAHISDPAGPSAAEATWAFFERFRLGRSGCVAAPPATPCTVTVRVPKRFVHAVRVRANGQRVAVRDGAVQVEAGARVVIRGRTRSGRRVRSVLTAPGCAGRRSSPRQPGRTTRSTARRR